MEYAVAGISSSIQASLIFLAVIYVAGCLGGRVLSLAGFSATHLTDEESALFALGVGLIALALGVLAVGLLGLLSKAVVWSFLIVSFAWFFICQKSDRFSFFAFHYTWFKRHGVWAFIALAFFLSWVSALAPAIATDALSYHLGHPREFIRLDRLTHLPDTRESLWPYQTEMLFTLGLLLQGTSLAQLFHWVFYPLTTAAVFLAGRRFYGTAAASWAALAFVFTPVAFAQSSQAYVDLSLAFYVFAAFYAFLLRNESGRNRAMFLSGLLCGGGVGTKFLGLGSAAILFVFWLVASRRRPQEVAARFLMACGLVGGVWYVRSWLILGNPVYPFLPQFFGGHGVPSTIGEGLGMGGGLQHYLALLWNITFHSRAFGGELLGPLLLCFLPLLVLYGRCPTHASLHWVLFGTLYSFFIFTQAQQVRFFLSVVPFLCVGVGVAMGHLSAKPAMVRKLAVTIFTSILTIHTAIYVYYARNIWGVVLGQVSAVEYLSRFERSFKGHRYLYENLGPGETVFNSADAGRFYNSVKGAVIDGPFFRRALKQQGKDIHQYLKERRFDYLWLMGGTDSELFEYAARYGYQEVYSYAFMEIPQVFHYHIFKMKQ